MTTHSDLQALILAMATEDTTQMREILQLGFEFNHDPNECTWDAIHWACDMDAPQAAQTLFEFGANPNAKDNNGDTPLHLVSKSGATDMIDVLLDAGANINEKSAQESMTPLHLAFAAGRPEFARVLIAKGANLRVKDSDGCTPIHTAAANDSLTRAIISVLPDNEIHNRDEDGRTLLHIAAQGCGHNTVQYLCEDNRIDINAKNDDFENALHCATKVGNTGAMKVLIEQGIHVNELDAKKKSALHWACASGNLNAAKILIQAGADLELTNGQGIKPLDYESAQIIRQWHQSSMIQHDIMHSFVVDETTPTSKPPSRSISL